MDTFIKATRKGGPARPAPVKAYCTAKPALTLLACAICGVLMVASAPALAQVAPEASGFDIEMLKQRGIDPKLAEYFRDAAKFTEGVRVVSLMVNGVKLGRIDARFDNQGQLCFNENLLAKARLQVPADEFLLSKGGTACYDFVAAFPQTEVTLRPNQEEVFLVVPQDALLGEMSEAGNFSSGGTAVILNYDVLGMRTTFEGASQDYLSASTELGFNMGDWIVRSRQMYTQNQDVTSFDQLYTYAQRTLPEHKAVVQAGEININSPVFAGAPITGLQVVPETALLEDTGSGAVVEGIAQSQSTVEVRQAGVLIYTTLVPEGPFALTNIPLLNTGTDLDVTVRETNGAERHFVVPAASFRTSVRAQPGFSFAVGRVRDLADSGSKEPLVATAAGAKHLGENLTVTAGGMLADGYQAVGGGADISLGRDTSLSVRNLYSSATEEGARGAQVSAAVGMGLTEKLSASFSMTQQTRGYRDISDTLLDLDDDLFTSRFQSQYTASIGWSDTALGGFNLGYSSSRSFDGTASNRLSGSWGKTFKRATVTASVETSMGGDSGADDDNALFLSVSVPLGTRSVRAYTSRSGDTLRTGAALTEVVNERVSYRVAAERSATDGSDREGGSNFASANLSLLPNYAAVDLGYAQSDTSASYNGRIAGGVVAHKEGITFSPYQVQDTFGIVDIGDISGVKIATPYGPVWTDMAGQAVVPQLSAYRNSRIVVQTESLPRNVDLKNGFQTVGAGRGSVNHLAFEVIRAQRVLVTAVDANGQPLPKGASVLDTANNFITTVLDSGTVFLSNADPRQVLKVALPDENTCVLDITFPEETDNEAYYDVAPGVCRA